jgi:hypothetical protein
VNAREKYAIAAYGAYNEFTGIEAMMNWARVSESVRARYRMVVDAVLMAGEMIQVEAGYVDPVKQWVEAGHLPISSECSICDPSETERCPACGHCHTCHRRA